jgi:hypothetical protein
MSVVTTVPLIVVFSWPATGDRDSAGAALHIGGQCDSDCGSACTKKQWCGSNECEPWPHYCWKC